MRDYPFFAPPEALAERTPREWSSKEAREYMQWFLSAMPGRIEHLLAYLGVDPTRSPAALLDAAGARCAVELRAPEFSRGHGLAVALTDKGYALAADMGLLVADLAKSTVPDLARWEILKKPRSAAAFHLPVLVTGNPLFFEPVGASIGQAHGVLRGERNSEIWSEMYETFVRRAQE